MKVFILPLALIFVIQITQSSVLRRKPKTYNALITTDQYLTPSRVYPVIQPHLQETYALPSYSYRSYPPLGGFHNSGFRNSGFHNSGFHNNGFNYGSAAVNSVASYNGFHNYPKLSPGLVEGRNFFPIDEIHTALPPTNDLGLPPALIPINSFELGNLAPYAYGSYPLIYEQYAGSGGYLSNLLPPYNLYPPGLDIGNIAGNGKKSGTSKDEDNNSPGSPSGTNGGSGGSSGSTEASSDGGSGSSSGGSGSSSGGAGSSGGGGSSNGGNSSSGSSGGSSSSSSVSTSSSTRSSRSRNLKKPE